MSLPANLVNRLALAFAVALLVVLGLAYTVEVIDREFKGAQRGGPQRAGDRFVGRAGQPGASAFEPGLPRHGQALGCEVTPLVGTLAVSAVASSLPSDVAPVIEVLSDGSLALRRPVPLASGPAAGPPPSKDGHGAGLILPGVSLSDLSPEARGALCGLLLRWFPQRPLPSARLRPYGYRLRAGDLARLLPWLP